MKTLTLKHKITIAIAILVLIPLLLIILSMGIKKPQIGTPEKAMPTTMPTTAALTTIPTSAVVTTPSFGPTSTQTGSIPTPPPLPHLQLLASDPSTGSTNVSLYTTVDFVFNRFIEPGETSVTISPATPFTVALNNTHLDVTTPSKQPNTLYTITILFSDGRKATVTINTGDLTNSINEGPSGTSTLDSWMRTNRPDLTVYNFVPDQSGAFTIQAVSKPDHYSFIVSASSVQGKSSFLDWLQNTVGLTTDEIAKLDIQYQ